tara:strand:- start:411 stop:824 length:414 start_codon:yes stop_codon:yes gene_type:complete
MPLFADRVKESTITEGSSGIVDLLGSTSGFVTFADGVGVGGVCYYSMSQQVEGEWEVGVGTVGSDTITRDLVLASSNNGALVNFSAGVKDIFVTIPAEYLNNEVVETDHREVTAIYNASVLISNQLNFVNLRQETWG